MKTNQHWLRTKLNLKLRVSNSEKVISNFVLQILYL
jgi:hypothetical protein